MVFNAIPLYPPLTGNTGLPVWASIAVASDGRVEVSTALEGRQAKALARAERDGEG